MNQLQLGELFTEQEIAQVVTIVQGYRMPHNRLLRFVEPLMPRINERTGQANDARYFAYLLEGVVRQHIKGASA